MGGRAWIRLLGLAAVAGAFGSLDSMLNVAFPDLIADLGRVITDVQWLVVAYVLASGGALIAAGRLGDTFGYRRMLAIGGGASAIGLLACAAAPTFPVLVGGRVIQGLGTAFVMASAPALLAGSASDDERGRALGLFQMSAAVGLALGPLVGGPLVSALGWRSVFWIRAPVGLALGLAARRSLAGARPTGAVPVGAGADPVDQGRYEPGSKELLPDLPTGDGPAPRGQFGGPALLAATLVMALVAFNLSLSIGPGAPLVLALAACGVGLAVWLTVHQRRSEDPVVALDVLRRPAFLTANALAVVANGAAFVGWLFIPQYVVKVLAWPTWTGGVVLASGPAATALVAPLAGRLSDRIGPAVVAATGLVVLTLGLALGGLVAPGGSVPALIVAWAAAGLGLGLFTVPNMAYVFATLPPDRQGVAGGLVLTMRTVGIVVGVALLSRLFAAGEERGFGVSLGRTFLVAAAATGAAAVVSVVRLRSGPASAPA